jgi:hypothetical protein
MLSKACGSLRANHNGDRVPAHPPETVHQSAASQVQYQPGPNQLRSRCGVSKDHRSRVGVQRSFLQPHGVETATVDRASKKVLEGDYTVTA